MLIWFVTHCSASEQYCNSKMCWIPCFPHNLMDDVFQTSMRKEFPQGLGGSDTCHFCKKRVYIMERLSAEGFFFHRECFRCNICGCTLRLGGHAFDSNQGVLFVRIAFIIKVHFYSLEYRSVEWRKWFILSFSCRHFLLQAALFSAKNQQ